MTYQQNFVERMERAAAKIAEEGAGYHAAFRADFTKRVKAVELMAAQFKAGDFDADLMERVGMLLDDEAMREEASRIANDVISSVGVTTLLDTSADELLREVLDRARMAWEYASGLRDDTGMPF